MANQNCFISRDYAYYALIDELRKQANLIGYDVMTILIEDFEKDIRKLSNRPFDGVIIVDVMLGYIHQITNRFYVPVVFIDSIINDPIFSIVISDYHSAIEEAKELLNTSGLFLVIDNYNNDGFKQYIFNDFSEDNIFVKTDENSLEVFLQSKKDMCGIVVGDILGLMTEKILDTNKFVVFTSSSKKTIVSDSTKKIALSNKSKSKQAINTLKKKIDLVFEANDDIVLLTKLDD